MLTEVENILAGEGEDEMSSPVVSVSEVKLATGGATLAPGRLCRFGAVDIKYHAGSNSNGIDTKYVRGRRRDNIIFDHVKAL